MFEPSKVEVVRLSVGSIGGDLNSAKKIVKGDGNGESNQTEAEGKNTEIVDWEGAADPAYPRNWKQGHKLLHLGFLSSFTLYSNLAAVMFAPGAKSLCEEFDITNSVVAALTVSIYILGFSLGPLFISPMSELYGRLIVYHIGNIVYVAFTIGCVLSTNAGHVPYLSIHMRMCSFFSHGYRLRDCSGPLTAGGAWKGYGVV